MSIHNLRSFGLSLLIHGAFALVLVGVFATRQSEITQAVTQVFVLMCNSEVLPADAPSPRNPAIQIRLPQVTHTEIIPAPTMASRRAPAESRPTRSEAAPNGTQMSLAEFRQRHGNDTTAQRTSRQPTAIPRVQESFQLAPGAGVVSGETADASFGPNLLRDLKSVFVNSGIDRTGLITTVEFTLSADGRLSNLRLLRSSGDGVFDAAVLTAFGKVRARNFAHDNIDKTYQVQFRSSNE